MKALKLAVAFIAFSFPAFAGANLSLPGTTGPSLGDTNANLYTYGQALQNNSFASTISYATLTSTSSLQSGCTLLGYGFSFLTTSLSAAGAACLPSAKPGSEVDFVNNTGQVVSVYGVTPTTLGLGAGGNDFINGTIATTNMVLTNAFSAQCIAYAPGNWWCQRGQ